MIKLTPVQIENLLAIRNGFATIEDFENFYEVLYVKFESEMPYGTAKARDGDPIEWINNRIVSMTADEYANFVDAQI